jgi:hypothetical protein
VGETAAPPKVENDGGGRTPPQISRRKDQPGRLGTKEKASIPLAIVIILTMQALLNVTKFLALKTIAPNHRQKESCVKQVIIFREDI